MAEHSWSPSEHFRSVKVNTYVTKSRIKRDILYSIDFLVGM